MCTRPACYYKWKKIPGCWPEAEQSTGGGSDEAGERASFSSDREKSKEQEILFLSTLFECGRWDFGHIFILPVGPLGLVEDFRHASQPIDVSHLTSRPLVASDAGRPAAVESGQLLLRPVGRLGFPTTLYSRLEVEDYLRVASSWW